MSAIEALARLAIKACDERDTDIDAVMDDIALVREVLDLAREGREPTTLKAAEEAVLARGLKTQWANDARHYKLAAAEIVKLAHPEAFADVAGLAWALGDQSGPIPPGAFPLWASPDCKHEPERQRRDGRGTICLDCGVARIIA